MRLGVAWLIALTGIIFPVAALGQADVAIAEFLGSEDGGGCGGVGVCGPPPYSVTPGGHAIFYLRVINNGPAIAANVVSTITFPTDTSVSSAGGLLGSATCSSSIVSGNQVVTCTQPSLAAGASFSAFVALILDTDYPWERGLIASATATAASADPVASNNTATASVYVAPPAGIGTIPTLDLWSVALLVAVLAMAAVFRMR